MRNLWKKYGWIITTIVGSFIFGAGYAIFLCPNDLNAGGISGLAAIIVQLINPNGAIPLVSVGTLTILINLPLFAIGGVKIGRRFFFGSLLGLGVSSLAMDYLPIITPLQRDDKKLGAPTTTPYNAAGVSMEDYRRAILSVCEKNGIATIDLYNLEGMRLEDATFPDYFDDGLHPNDAGSTFLAKPILAKVKELLGR